MKMENLWWFIIIPMWSLTLLILKKLGKIGKKVTTTAVRVFSFYLKKIIII